MADQTKWQVARRGRVMRHVLFVLGCLLMIAAPIAAPLPGPAGTLLFAAGLALLLETSPWAKRVYVRSKRRWPRIGQWLDWGMRRKSEQRRRARAKLVAAKLAIATTDD